MSASKTPDMQIGVFIPIGNNGTKTPSQKPIPETIPLIIFFYFRLDNIRNRTALQAHLRAQQGDRPESRTVRFRLCPLDDKDARLRRRDRALGLQSRVLHLDGRTCCRDQEDQALRLDSNSRSPPRRGGEDGVDDRFDRAREVRDQHRDGVADG